MTLTDRKFVLTVNARNGTVAERIAALQLKRMVIAGTRHRESGEWVEAFDVEGFSRTGPNLPDDKVALAEVTQHRTSTYNVHVILWTRETK